MVQVYTKCIIKRNEIVNCYCSIDHYNFRHGKFINVQIFFQIHPLLINILWQDNLNGKER